LAAHDPDDRDRRVLAVVKSNLAPTPKSLGYQLVPAGAFGAARVLWVGETAHTASSLLDEPDAEPEALTEAEHWLEDYVISEGGCVTSKDAKRSAAKVGVAERTLQRAAKKLPLAVESHGYPRQTFWSWPVCRAIPPGHKNLGATGATGDKQPKRGGSEPQSRQSRQDCVTGATGAPPCDECGDKRAEHELNDSRVCTDCLLAANDKDNRE
jgi:hypothetical protein